MPIQSSCQRNCRPAMRGSSTARNHGRDGDAGGADRGVRELDRRVEGQPVHRNHDADGGVGAEEARRHCAQPAPDARHDQQRDGDEQHAPAHEVERGERDDLAEYRRESPTAIRKNGFATAPLRSACADGGGVGGRDRGHALLLRDAQSMFHHRTLYRSNRPQFQSAHVESTTGSSPARSSCLRSSQRPLAGCVPGATGIRDRAADVAAARQARAGSLCRHAWPVHRERQRTARGAASGSRGSDRRNDDQRGRTQAPPREASCGSAPAAIAATTTRLVTGTLRKRHTRRRGQDPALHAADGSQGGRGVRRRSRHGVRRGRRGGRRGKTGRFVAAF